MKIKVTKQQREILFGILLGDAHAEYSPNRKSVRLKIEQSLFHRPYVNHLLEVFRDWVPGEVFQIEYLMTNNAIFSTVFSPTLVFYADQFYREGGLLVKKKVPKLLHRWLTPQGLAYWYMDDGSSNQRFDKSKQSKGVVLNTQGFSFADVQRLCQILETKFGLECKPRRQREGHQIYVSGRSYKRLGELILPFLLPEMMYKFPPKRIPRKPSKPDKD